MKIELLKALQWRYAVKKYDPGFKLSEDDKETLETILQLTPSSYGLQPLHFIWLEDQLLREETKKIAWNQQQIVDASGVIILCAKTNLDTDFLDTHVDNMRDTREMQEEQIKGFRAHLHAAIGAKDADTIKVWNDKQAYIALGQVLTACALLQLDATPMEGFDPLALDQLLELDQNGLRSILICTIGKRAADDQYQHLKKIRRAKKELFSTR